MIQKSDICSLRMLSNLAFKVWSCMGLWRKSAGDVCDVFLQLFLHWFGILWEVLQENLKMLIFRQLIFAIFLSFCLIDFSEDSSSPLWIQKDGIDVFKIVSNVWYFFQLLLIVKHSKAEIRFLEEFGISMHAQKENTFCAAFALFDANDFWFDLTVSQYCADECLFHYYFTLCIL